MLLRHTFHTARKRYVCDTHEYILDSCNQGIYSLSDYRTIVKHKRRRFAIEPGDRYIKQVIVADGDLIVNRMIPELYEIIMKYDLFDD